MVTRLTASLAFVVQCVTGSLSEADWPRFVLCPQVTNETKDIGDIAVFAASVVSQQPRPGRLHKPLSLRAALVQHGGRWDLALARQPDGLEHVGHAKQVPYEKCFGGSLPAGTRVFCGIGKTGDGGRNTSWMEGRLAQFDTGEVRQSFATCAIDRFISVKKWRKHPSRWPLRLHMRLWLDLPERSKRRVLRLELCRVDKPLLNISFCSQPLYSFKAMLAEWPHTMEDWLAYHLDYLGFSHGDIYDVDGSFAEALEPWIRANSWRKSTVSYFHKWPRQLSQQLSLISESHPYCTEILAYIHCLTSHAARSRWVALLHAPDEYLVTPKTPYAGALLHVLEYLSADLPHELPFAFFQVNAVSFASGSRPPQHVRGGVLAASRLRMPMVYHHMPLADPLYCWAAGPHMCYGEARQLCPNACASASRSPVVQRAPRQKAENFFREGLTKEAGMGS